MKVLRILGVAALVGLLVLLFATPRRATKEASDRKYPNRVPVRFWHMWSAEWKDVVDKIVDRYNKSQTKYEVIALSVPSGGDTKFLLGTIGGNPPDVMAQWNPVIPTWADSNLLTPFDELMSPAEKARFDREAYPIVKKIGLYKGKTYGIPIGINAYAIYYLPVEFRKAGIQSFPQTWEGLIVDGERLTKRDRKGTLTRLGFLPGYWGDLMPLFGGGMYDDARKCLDVGSEPNLRCLQSLVSLRKHYGYEAVLRFQSGLNTSSFAGGWPFIGGAYAAVMDGQWRVEQLAKYAPKLDYQTAPLPAPKGGRPGACLAGGNFMIVPRSAQQKKGAWDFVKFWSGLDNPKLAAEFYVAGGWLPMSERVAQAPAYIEYIRKHPQFKTFVDVVSSPDLEAQPPVPYQVFLSDAMHRYEDLALRGGIEPAAAVRELTQAISRELGRRKELGYEE